MFPRTIAITVTLEMLENHCERVKKNEKNKNDYINACVPLYINLNKIKSLVASSTPTDTNIQTIEEARAKFEEALEIAAIEYKKYHISVDLIPFLIESLEQSVNTKNLKYAVAKVTVDVEKDAFLTNLADLVKSQDILKVCKIALKEAKAKLKTSIKKYNRVKNFRTFVAFVRANAHLTKIKNIYRAACDKCDASSMRFSCFEEESIKGFVSTEDPDYVIAKAAADAEYKEFVTRFNAYIVTICKMHVTMEAFKDAETNVNKCFEAYKDVSNSKTLVALHKAMLEKTAAVNTHDTACEEFNAAYYVLMPEEKDKHIYFYVD